MNTWFPLRGHVAHLTLLVVLFIGGCAKKSDPVAGPDTTPSTGGSISDQARKASLDTLAVVFSRLPGVDPAADRQAALNFLRTRPEFEATGLSQDGGNVWARFNDGRLVLFVNNRKPGPGVVTPRINRSQIQSQTNRLSKTFEVLPGSSMARIMNSLGTAFVGSQRSVDSIRRWCKLAGYTLSTPDNPTIENLKSMNGDGIFYWTTHGGYGVNRLGVNQATYSLWTSDAVTPENDAKYEADLAGYYIDYMYAANDSIRGGGKSVVWHYTVNLWFIAHYMRFAPNSLVYFDACGSGEMDVSFSFVFENVGLYLGWSLPVADADADRTARFFFDRSLGVNMQTPKETPPQRPFFVGDILGDMMRRGFDKSGSSTLVHPFEPVLTTPLLLAPTIVLTSGQTDVNSKTYFIDGDFADDPGADGVVLLNEKPLSISKWASTKITVQKPESGGNLVVTVRNVKSNPVQLTEWHGSLDYTYTGKGSLKQHIVFQLGFWGDVHSFRPNIMSSSMYAPIPGVGRPVQLMKTSTCSYECSGEYRDTYGELQETWQGSGTLPRGDTGTPDSFSCSVLIDSAGTNSQLLLMVNRTFTQWTKNNGTSQQRLTITMNAVQLKHTMPDFVLQAGSTSVNSGTLTWNNFTATYPPDPKAAQ